MPKGVPLTPEEQTRRRKEIVNVALQLFVEKGFPETSMREIAAAIGAGKSTLYDYFKTKDDILLSYFEDELQAITQQAAEVHSQDLPPLEKLKRIMLAQMEYLQENKNFYMRLTVEAQRLGLASQQRIQSSRHAYQDMICQIIQAGVEEGSFRPVDARLTMRIMLSAIQTVVFTTRPSGTPEAMLDHALDIIYQGIQA